MPGPLSGTRVIELGGIGPGPFAGMFLADLGADVIRIDRQGSGELFPGDPQQDILNRGKRSAILDLKRPEAVDALLAMVAHTDVLIEGFRPGVTERLGLGPDHCRAHNPKLVYARMTGWGQTGPFAQTAGHDLNYIAITGALGAIGEHGGPPQIPLNMVGDFGGGGTYLVIGILAALREADASGLGQVVDAAIVDGVAHLLAGTHALLATGTWKDERGVNMLDGGAPFYSIYATSDLRYVAVGALESRFYKALLAGLKLDLDPALQNDRVTWPEMRRLFTQTFAAQPLAHWVTEFASTDACVSPVVSLREAQDNPHVASRGSVIEHDGTLQPGVAPRFSRSTADPIRTPPAPGLHSREILAQFGVENAEELLENGSAIQV
ncbi:CaiB/BaiF CoA transferase family protein [Mycobacterium sp. C31M]